MRQAFKHIKGFAIALMLLMLLGTQLSLPVRTTEDTHSDMPLAELLVPTAKAETAAERDAELERLAGEAVDAGRSAAIEAEARRRVAADEAFASRLGSERRENEATDPIAIDEMLTRVGKLSTYVNYIFNPGIHFFTSHIGGLLNNDYIFGGDMGKMLQNIWRVNRNLVNIAFVLILLYLALKYIFASEEGGSTDLKKILPMFAIMLVAVNFSWMASKVILDAANVVTNVVFSLPAGVKGVVGDRALESSIEECTIDDEKGTVKGMCVPVKIYKVVDAAYTADFKYSKNDEENQCKDIDSLMKEAYPSGTEYENEEGETVQEEVEPDENHFMYGTDVFCWKTIDFADYNQNNASYFLTYSMARMQNLTRASNKGFFKLAIGMIFSIVIQLVYLVAFASMFIAMIIRIAVLWFFVAFSPFIVLMLFMKKNLQEISLGEDTISLATFTQWAFAPAKVGAVWSVGFIMISTGQTLGENFFTKLNKTGEFSSKMYQIDTLFMGMDTLQQFIWLLMTVGIIWVGTFAVLTKLKFAEQIFNRINDYGKTVAKKVSESPTWAPIMPIYDYKEGRWKRGALSKMLPDVSKELDKLKSHFTDDEGAGYEKFSKGETKLKELQSTGTTEIRNFNTWVARKDESATQKKVFEFFSKHVGLTTKDVKERESAIRTMLRNSGDTFKANENDIMYMLSAAVRSGVKDPEGEKKKNEKEDVGKDKPAAALPATDASAAPGIPPAPPVPEGASPVPTAPPASTAQ